MKAVIIANGDLPSATTLRDLAAHADLVFATDGAVLKTGCDLPLSYICGDFDSIAIDIARLRCAAATIVELPDQNCSDLEKTILLALEKGALEITIVGGLGGRMDHSLVSLALLRKFHMTHKISLLDDGAELFYLSPECYHKGTKTQGCESGATVSLIAPMEDSLVSISGVRWPLEREKIVPGSQGVSNSASGGIVTVTVHQGVIAASFPRSTADNQLSRK